MGCLSVSIRQRPLVRRWEVSYLEDSVWRVAGTCVTKREARILRDSWCNRSVVKLKSRIVDRCSS